VEPTPKGSETERASRRRSRGEAAVRGTYIEELGALPFRLAAKEAFEAEFAPFSSHWIIDLTDRLAEDFRFVLEAVERDGALEGREHRDLLWLVEWRVADDTALVYTKWEVPYPLTTVVEWVGLRGDTAHVVAFWLLRRPARP
jgi:hypothetical protein